ncbi:hypothetical protein EVAR_74893_1 [Eumeta japonica]|uniref:Uncharacterized protein n=1 Tax=Eumeta variegata TaxID=151549 RepID=A0A4C1YYS1_EUMVA|nr:hypothetical protein EVAR_74893_1 [Eumeta japonica]
MFPIFGGDRRRIRIPKRRGKKYGIKSPSGFLRAGSAEGARINSSSVSYFHSIRMFYFNKLGRGLFPSIESVFYYGAMICTLFSSPRAPVPRPPDERARTRAEREIEGFRWYSASINNADGWMLDFRMRTSPGGGVFALRDSRPARLRPSNPQRPYPSGPFPLGPSGECVFCLRSFERPFCFHCFIVSLEKLFSVKYISRTESGSGIDIANKTKGRIESRDWMRMESRTQPCYVCEKRHDVCEGMLLPAASPSKVAVNG